jgi:putative addiction module CopG family antidote
VTGGGLYLTVLGLLGLGLGAVIRGSAGAIAALVGVLFVPPLVPALLPRSWRDTIGPYVPLEAGSQIYSLRHDAGALGAWSGFGVLCLSAAVALGFGFVLIDRRDAKGAVHPLGAWHLGAQFTVRCRPVLLLWTTGGTPMSIQLPPDVEASIRQKVQRGQFPDEAEVVREALQLLDERDRKRRLNAALAVGDEQYARGEVTTWTPDTLDQLMREADEEDRQGLPISDDVQP